MKICLIVLTYIAIQNVTKKEYWMEQVQIACWILIVYNCQDRSSVCSPETPGNS